MVIYNAWSTFPFYNKLIAQCHVISQAPDKLRQDSGGKTTWLAVSPVLSRFNSKKLAFYSTQRPLKLLAFGR